MTMSEDDIADSIKEAAERPSFDNAEQVPFYFQRQQRSQDGRFLADGYLNAEVSKSPSGTERLSVMLTAEQAQGWADTLAASLHDLRTQLNERMTDIDKVFVIRNRGENCGVAITKANAEQKKTEVMNNSPNVWNSDEVTIEEVPLFTGDGDGH